MLRSVKNVRNTMKWGCCGDTSGTTTTPSQLVQRPNQLTLSYDTNYPTSDTPKFMYWDTLNGTPCATNNAITNYLPYLIPGTETDMVPTADVAVNNNATWLECQTSGVYYINACIVFDDQNTTAYYQMQLRVRRNGVWDTFYRAQVGDAVVLNSDIKAMNLDYIGRFDAGDSVTLQVTFTGALDLKLGKGSYHVRSRLEWSKII